MGSLLSTKRSDDLKIQVVQLERALEKEKVIGMNYKERLERAQDYVRHCILTAQENGDLRLIGQNKGGHSEMVSLVEISKLSGWYISPDEVEMQENIGQGSTADIYRATWRGVDVAVKCIRPDFFLSNDNGIAFFGEELQILSRQRHRFVLQLMGACLDPPYRAWIVTELLHTTLHEWLHGPSKRRVGLRVAPLPPLRERLGRALEIAQALQYLHAQRPMVLHRDLKPSNVFLDHDLHVRVADFGHARFLSDEEKALSGETGTYVYMAPEVIKSEPYNEKCDVYSFGIILNELITGEYPYIHTHYGPTKIAMEVVENNLRPRLANDMNGQLGELIELICQSWNQDASLRPSFATITSTLKAFQNQPF